MYKEQKNTVSALIKQTRAKYYQQKLTDYNGDQRAVFKVANKLLHRKIPCPCTMAPDAMSSYFEEKIQRIWDQLSTSDLSLSFGEEPGRPPAPPLNSFRETNSDEILGIMKTMSNASCEQDPMPTSLLKKHARIVAPFIAKLVNASMNSGQVPDILKKAVVEPRLKKSTNDPNDPKIYRPISNLPFLSKVLERVVAARVTDHMTRNILHEPLQSAYKPAHRLNQHRPTTG
jgi:hypothetical protein